MSAATPALPLPATPPVGRVSTALEGWVAHTFGAALRRKFVKMYVVPEESARAATTILVAGSLTFGLSAWIAALFQFVM